MSDLNSETHPAQPVRRKSNFFSLEGRATRTEWWLTSIALSLLYLLGLAASLFTVQSDSDAISAFILVSVVFIGLTLPVTVRRLHDRNLSGWWILVFILLTPLFGLGALGTIVLGFLDGTPGKNRYGPSPFWHEVVVKPLTPQEAKFKLQKLEKLYEKKMISAAKYEEEKLRLQAIASGKPEPPPPPKATPAPVPPAASVAPSQPLKAQTPPPPPKATPVTTPPATPVAPVQPAKSDSVEARLAKIKELREKGILSEEEYAEQRARIISEL